MNYHPPMNTKYLEKAIKIAGGQTALAKLIGRRQSHVSTWLYRDKKVPAVAARLIDEALDGQVTRYQLRPDVFGQPEQAA